MKKILLSAFVLTICLGAIAQKTPIKTKGPAVKATVTTTAAISFKSLMDSFSYMAGFNVATNMSQQGIGEINTALMKKGIDDYLAKKQPALDPAAGNKALQAYIGICTEKKNAQDKIKADAEKAKGVAFLETNKKRKEVITLANGLQYEVIKHADSVAHKPVFGDTVVVNYVGSLMDGTEFQSSFKAGQPIVFALAATGMIKGWIEILQIMPVGSHWKIYLPTELAYGDSPPQGSGIPPGVPLVFDILLEGIKPPIKQ